MAIEAGAPELQPQHDRNGIQRHLKAAAVTAAALVAFGGGVTFMKHLDNVHDGQIPAVSSGQSQENKPVSLPQGFRSRDALGVAFSDSNPANPYPFLNNGYNEQLFAGTTAEGGVGVLVMAVTNTQDGSSTYAVVAENPAEGQAVMLDPTHIAVIGGTDTKKSDSSNYLPPRDLVIFSVDGSGNFKKVATQSGLPNNANLFVPRQTDLHSYSYSGAPEFACDKVEGGSRLTVYKFDPTQSGGRGTPAATLFFPAAA